MRSARRRSGSVDFHDLALAGHHLRADDHHRQVLQPDPGAMGAGGGGAGDRLLGDRAEVRHREPRRSGRAAACCRRTPACTVTRLRGGIDGDHVLHPVEIHLHVVAQHQRRPRMAGAIGADDLAGAPGGFHELGQLVDRGRLGEARRPARDRLGPVLEMVAGRGAGQRRRLRCARRRRQRATRQDGRRGEAGPEECATVQGDGSLNRAAPQCNSRQRGARRIELKPGDPRRRLTVMPDLRYGLRSLAKSRAFTAAAILTLALGIGASTAIYSVIQNVLMTPFPYKGADRSVRDRDPRRRAEPARRPADVPRPRGA